MRTLGACRTTGAWWRVGMGALWGIVESMGTVTGTCRVWGTSVFDGVEDFLFVTILPLWWGVLDFLFL